MHARFSRDGRFFAYTSAESGRLQLYVETFPPTGGRWQVSAEGGFEPVWRDDGRELFLIGLDRRLMAVPVRLKESFEQTSPVPLFTTRVPNVGNPFRTSYDVTHDGQRFLIRTMIESAAPASITVMSNWPELLKR